MLEYLITFYWLVLPLLASMIFIFWYLFMNDRDVFLAIAENFGRSVSYYRGKVFWITGASTGLGEAMAYELASVGAKLILTARSEDLLQNVKEVCLSKSRGNVSERDILVLPFDITDLETHQKHVDAAIAYFGKIDVFLNNVAQGQMGSIHATSFDVTNRIFQVNFFGGIHLTQILIKHFLQRKRGQIIVVSSLGGKAGSPGTALYVATKHALHGLYDSLRIEYNNENIKVTIVCPGPFKSNLGKDIVGNTEEEVHHNIGHNMNQMSARRCARLSLIAGANHLYEVWISYQPFLLVLLISQHFSDAFKYLVNFIWTRKNLDIIVNGQFLDNMSPWKPIFSKED